ncbi:MAG: creatininase family protein [Spirochaetota bacterium]|nr:MAG: creatininase family protein [Spirochaetota bacterium]
MKDEVVSYCLLDMSCVDIQNILKKTDAVMIPTGSCEMHGPHLPVGTDTFQGIEITRRAAKIAGVPYTHQVWMGYSPHHLREPEKGMGTITLRASTYHNLLYDIAKSLIHHGFNKLVFVNNHSSNMKVMDPIMRKLRYETGAFIMVTNLWGERYLGIIEDLMDGPEEETPGWHAGELETAQVMAYDERLVRMDRAIEAKAHTPEWIPNEFAKKDGTWNVAFKGYEYFYFPMEHNEFAPHGIMGNPFRATKEKGEKTLNRYAEYLAEALEIIKKVKVQIKVREFTDHA